MKPVIIFRFLGREGPGYLGTFLDEKNIPWQLIKIDEGEPVPSSILAHSGMVLMGGPMSVNDDLPWIPPLLDLVREAKANDIPLIGHCLGGQLMSKALGASVTRNPVKEIGWGEVSVSKNEAAKNWFGNIETFNAFHWHGETFVLPEGAIHLLSSPYCQNQAWSIGKHLAFQTHIEMTTDMVQKWCEEGETELSEAANSPLDLFKGVQQADEMQKDLPLHCFFLNKVAKQVYMQWIQWLKT
ncbi:MAG: type 1 glutamine amidotransferase [Methylotenera sp.]